MTAQGTILEREDSSVGKRSTPKLGGNLKEEKNLEPQDEKEVYILRTFRGREKIIKNCF